eukprot:scaffold407748_cov17-Prasinocladus_malaysianus.AAC.1
MTTTTSDTLPPGNPKPQTHIVFHLHAHACQMHGYTTASLEISERNATQARDQTGGNIISHHRQDPSNSQEQCLSKYITFRKEEGMLVTPVVIT